uniref:GPI mannosyltransferase 2 n=1 Tax=Pyrodinium bahamense TaxID=73915 RepID=A0A7R9ZUG9_9DINO|mmetsp:Transcript_10160/g.28372  ORF Transcript_10160/g.28372 Transcript_10160/m.28372 type:complete len:221 (+) Transcript_10160:82-744(+)
MAAVRTVRLRRRMLLYLPSTLLATYFLTLLICIQQSIAANGGTPCHKFIPCDVSVYGGLPKYGPEFLTFRLGFTLMGMQLAPLGWARLTSLPPSSGCALCTQASAYVLAIFCLMLMAYIPFWQSPLHFLFAVLTFLFLAIAQCADATQAAAGFRCSRCVILVCTMSCFTGWAVSSRFLGYHLSVLEYIATFLPFGYFLTWSVEVANSTVLPEGGSLLLIE